MCLVHVLRTQWLNIQQWPRTLKFLLFCFTSCSRLIELPQQLLSAAVRVSERCLSCLQLFQQLRLGVGSCCRSCCLLLQPCCFCLKGSLGLLGNQALVLPARCLQVTSHRKTPGVVSDAQLHCGEVTSVCRVIPMQSFAHVIRDCFL